VSGPICRDIRETIGKPDDGVSALKETGIEGPRVAVSWLSGGRAVVPVGVLDNGG